MEILKKLGKTCSFFLILLLLAFTAFSTSCTPQKSASKSISTPKKERKSGEIKKPTLIEFYAPW